MKTKIYYFLPVLLMLAISSCKKEETVTGGTGLTVTAFSMQKITEYAPVRIKLNNLSTAADSYTEAERFHIAGDKNLYELTFSNKGGLVMPLIIEWTFKDGTKEIDRIPVQVWRKNENKVIKTFMKDKEVASIRLDPMRETADIDETNNVWNTMPEPSKFQLFKARSGGNARGGSTGQGNPMQKEIK